jgi:hypothetical protein
MKKGGHGSHLRWERLLGGLPRAIEGAAWHRYEIAVVLLDRGADEKDIGLVAKRQAYRRRGARSQRTLTPMAACVYIDEGHPSPEGCEPVPHPPDDVTEALVVLGGASRNMSPGIDTFQPQVRAGSLLWPTHLSGTPQHTG